MQQIAGVVLLIVLVGTAAFAAGRRTRRNTPEPPDPSRSLFNRISRLEKEQQRASEVIEGMSEGVLVVSDSITPVLANQAARRLLTLPGSELPPSIPSDEVTSTARRCISERSVIESDLNWSAAGLSLRVRAVPLEPEGAVLFLHDNTEELRTQQLRRQFVANASHELKTPVSSLQTLVEAIRNAIDEDPAAAQRFAEQMTTESQRMAALIDDLMDLSRVEDPASMHVTEADFSQIVTEEVKTAFGRAADGDVGLEDAVTDGVRVKGDAQQLHLMVRNLVENAIRYTPHGGDVRVSLSSREGRAYLQVTDTGVGIPLQAQGRIFERFYRVDEDRARISGGTGLGLSIVKNVAESHGGTVSVTSELDEGSTFTVGIPLMEEP
jgi:two-component system sensor histidine kinase SenX3